MKRGAILATQEMRKMREQGLSSGEKELQNLGLGELLPFEELSDSPHGFRAT